MAKRKKIAWPWPPSDLDAAVSFSVFVRDELWTRIEFGEETYASIAKAADLSTPQVWRFINGRSKLTISNFDKLVALAVVKFKLFEITSE
jgi:hypothetical protein